MHSRINTVVGRLMYGTRMVGLKHAAVGFARLIWLRIRSPESFEVTTTNRGLKFSLHYPSQLMPLLVVFNELIEPELDMVAAILRKGLIAVDIGASVGTWAIFAAKSGAIVHACEPDTKNYATLVNNININGLKNVLTYQVAIGSVRAFAEVSEGSRSYCNQFMVVTEEVGDGLIPMITLDEFSENHSIPSIDILKINTAGREIDVLSGAKKLFLGRKVKVALILDGRDARDFVFRDEISSLYSVGYYDACRKQVISVKDKEELNSARPTQMNRYLVLKLK